MAFAISPAAHKPDNTNNKERQQEQTVLQLWESKRMERERRKQARIKINISKMGQV